MKVLAWNRYISIDRKQSKTRNEKPFKLGQSLGNEKKNYVKVPATVELKFGICFQGSSQLFKTPAVKTIVLGHSLSFY